MDEPVSERAVGIVGRGSTPEAAMAQAKGHERAMAARVRHMRVLSAYVGKDGGTWVCVMVLAVGARDIGAIEAYADGPVTGKAYQAGRTEVRAAYGDDELAERVRQQLIMIARHNTTTGLS